MRTSLRTGFTVFWLLGMAAALFSAHLANASIKSEKEWTLLVFMNGFNSLSSFGPRDLNEMEQVGSTENVNVVVQWASLTNMDVRRVFVMKDNDPAKVTSPVLQNLGKVDMGDYKNLVEFVRWAKEHYPAKHYFVDVWNHGSGWHRVRLNGNAIRPTDISNDDLTGNSITTEQLGVAMKEIKTILGQNVDLYGSDACLMSMVEVAGEMKDSVDVFVGSQHLEPGDGWPYHLLLKGWNELADRSARNVAKVLVNAYAETFKSQSNITLSAFDMTKYEALAKSVRDLSSVISTLPNETRAKAKNAFASTQFLYDLDYRDLHDLSNELGKSLSEAEVSRGMLTNVKSVVESFVIENRVSANMSRAHGVSIWAPTSRMTYDQYADRYEGLIFNRDTDWKASVFNTIRE